MRTFKEKDRVRLGTREGTVLEVVGLAVWVVFDDGMTSYFGSGWAALLAWLPPHAEFVAAQGPRKEEKDPGRPLCVGDVVELVKSAEPKPRGIVQEVNAVASWVRIRWNDPEANRCFLFPLDTVALHRVIK